MIGVLEVLAARWPLLLAAAFPFVMTTLVTTVFFMVHKLVSSSPDSLGETTAEWVQRHIDGLGLTGLSVGPSPPGDAGIDAFWPHANYIMLKQSTLSRRDPAFWAIGAHELGHALHVRMGLWGTLFPLGRALAHGLSRLGTAALVAHALLGVQETAVAAWVVLCAVLVADALVLLDEGWASLTAHRLLVADGQLDASQLRRASVSLLGAMSAYLAGTIARLAVLFALPWLLSLAVGGAFPAAERLTLTGTVMLAALTSFLLIQATRVLFRMVRPKRLFRLSDIGPHTFMEAMSDLAGGVGALGLIRVLSAHQAPGLSIALWLAMVPALIPLAAVLSHILLLPAQVMLRGFQHATRSSRAFAEGAVPENGPVPSPMRAPPTLPLTLYNDRPWVARGLDTLRVAYLPLVLVAWVAWAMGTLN